MSERETADFWFDPSCPWTWMTSRWMLEVQKVRPVDVRWHVLSLSALNEDRDLPPDHRAVMDGLWGPVRVIAAARELHGEQYVKALYDAMGTRFHPGGDVDRPAVIVTALAEVGLPAELARYADTDEFDPQLRAGRDEVLALAGGDVGSPVVAVNGVAFHGPVVAPAPKGEAAGRLWDGVVLLAGTPGFFDVKRPRTQDPVFD